MNAFPPLKTPASFSYGPVEENTNSIPERDKKIRALERERDQMRSQLTNMKSEIQQCHEKIETVWSTQRNIPDDVSQTTKLTSMESEIQLLKQISEQQKQQTNKVSASIDETTTKLESLREHTTRGLSSLNNDVAQCHEKLTTVQSTQRKTPNKILQTIKLVQFMNIQLDKMFKRIGQDIHTMKNTTETLISSNDKVAKTI